MENNENNIQNQEKKQSKGLSVGLVIIMLIAVLIIGIGGGYLLSKNDSLFSKNETKSNSNNSNTTQSDNNTSTENNTTEQSKASKKIDESKPWVYDANYGDGKEDKKISPEHSNDIYSTMNKLKVPYINVNSEYAKNLNSEIKKIYDNAYNEFGTETVNQGGNTVTNVREIKYETYNKNNILSIVLTINSGVLNGGITHEYKTYNIDLGTLNKASLLDVGKAAGFQSQDELDKAINASLLNAQKSKISSENAVRKDDLYYMDNTGILNMMVLSMSEMGLTNIKITNSATQTISNNNSTPVNDVQKYLGQWYDEGLYEDLRINSIENNIINFDFGILRTVSYTGLTATYNPDTLTAEFNTNNTDEGDYWKGVYGNIKLRDNEIVLEITKSDCEIISPTTYVFNYKK